MEKIGNIINSYTVNGKYNKSIHTVNSSTVDSKTVDEKIADLLKEENIKPEGVAQMLAEGLSDLNSLGYYLLLVKNNNPEILLKALYLTKETDSLGKIKTKKAIYFLGILKNWKVQTKFRKESEK